MMNKKQNDLPDLINALSINEKRHFSLFSKAFSGGRTDSLYLKLFDWIEKGSYELLEDKLNTSSGVVAKTKQRLYANLLKSLRIYYQDKSLDISIQNLLSEIEVVYKLGLANQGQLLVRKANALANNNERYGLLLQVLEWEKKLSIVSDSPSRSHQEIVKEEKATLDKLSQIMALENIYTKTMVLKRQYGYAKGEARIQLEKETVQAAEMPAPKDCLSNKALFYHNFIYALYYWMIFDHGQSFLYSKKLLNTEKNAILPNDFIGALLQHITSSVCLGYFEEALNGIRLGEVYVNEYHLDQSRSFKSLMYAYQATYEMIVYNYKGQHTKLRSTIKRAEEKLHEFDQALSFELRQIVQGNLMNAYMGIGDGGKADEIWDSMFNKQSSAIRRDIYADLYLFRLFRLLQSKTYALLPSAALSASRYYRKFDDANEVFEVEMPIALLLQKKHDWERPEVLKKIIGQLRTIVQYYINGLKGARRFQEHYSRYVIWCDAIIRDEAYHLAAARWYKIYKNTNHT